MANKKPVPAIDLLLPSAKLVRDNLPVFGLFLVLPLLLSTVTGQAPELSEEPSLRELIEATRAAITPFMVAGSVMSLIFYPFLTYAQLQAAKKGHVTIKQAISGGSRRYMSLLALWLTILLSVIAGLALFILPGIILLRGFVLAPYFLLDKNLGIFEALKTSFKKSKQYKWPIYGVLGVVVLFNLLTSLGPLGQVAGTILSTLYTMAFALRYREVDKG